MKKLLSLILATVIVTSLFAGCAKKDADTKSESQSQSATAAQTKVATLKGPTGMGMVELMNQNELGKTDYKFNFSISGAPDEIVSKISSGTVDIAAVPTNLASTLYNKTKGKVNIIAINTLGVLYILDKNSNINSIADLKGKTIYASGKGSTPEYVLNDILEKNGLKPNVDVTIEYKSEHTEVSTLLATKESAIAMLPEPFVTSVMMKDAKIKIASDLTKEWEKSNPSSKLAMGAIIVRTDFLEKNKAIVDYFLGEYKKSQEYVNKNHGPAAKLIQKYDIMPEAVALKAIPKSNIVCITGDDMKTQASELLKVLFAKNPISVGGKLPDDKFYYKK
jgi:NitT/TauT family transport system substrate-binding protein